MGSYIACESTRGIDMVPLGCGISCRVSFLLFILVYPGMGAFLTEKRSPKARSVNPYLNFFSRRGCHSQFRSLSLLGMDICRQEKRIQGA